MKKTAQFILLIFLFCLPPSGFAQESAPDTVRVGIFPFEPFNFIDDNGEAQGLNCDLLRKISKIHNGPPLEFIPVTWAEGFQKLQTEELDLMVSAARSADREEVMEFNQFAVAEVWSQIFTLPSKHIEEIAELKGKRVGVMRQDINGKNFIQLAKSLSVNCEIIEYPTHDAVFAAVGSGEVDSGVAPHHYGIQHAKEHALTGTPVQFSPFPVFFASKKGLHKPFLAEIDTQLISWKQEKDSFYYNRLNYWLGGNRTWHEHAPAWLWFGLAGIICVALGLLFINEFLKRQVRKKTKALRKNERLLSKMMESIGDVIVIIDRKGINRYKSPSIEKWFGWKPEELLHKPIVANVHPQDSDAVTELLNKLANTPNATETIECRYLSNDGSYKWIEFSVTNLLQDPDIKGLLGNYHDITARKEAEVLLQRTEKNFRSMIETLPLTIYLTTGIEQTLEYMNPTFVDLLGYTAEDIPSVEEFMPLAFPDPDYRKKVAAEWTEKVQRALDTQSPIEPMETVVVCKDGSEKIMLWGYVPLDEKNYAYGLDLTEQTKAAEKLAASAMHLKLAQSTARLGSWEQDGTTGEVFWSDLVYQLLGINQKKEHLTIQDFFERVHPDDLQCVDEAFKSSLIPGNPPYEHTQRIIRLDTGEIRYLHERCTHFRDADGNVIKSIGTVQDVTERRQTEEDQKEYARFLKQVQHAAVQKQELLQFIFDSLPVGICWNRVNADGTETRMINDAHLRIAGISREQDNEETWLRINHPDNPDSRNNPEGRDPFISEMAAGKIEHYKIDKRYIHPDGRIVWVEFSRERKRLEHGGFEDLCSVVDITERVQAEENLRESEERYRSTIDDLQVGVIVYAEDTSIVLSNPEVCRMLGLTAEQIAGKTAYDPIWTFIREDGSTMPSEEFPVLRVMSTGKSSSNQTMGIIKPGHIEPVWIRASAVPIFSTSSLSELAPRHRPNFLRAGQLSGGNRFVKRK
ncbi:PAS domain S-box protein, partial [Pontiellaceae bacterium B12219]|nr:PAS domain S-box protein [Pontiellaceae bacterium B12219]